MKRIVILLLALIFLVSGCGPDQTPEILIAEDMEDNKIVRLADVDFVPVPKFTFYVLLEEKLAMNNLLFVRRFAKYDGFSNDVSEELQEVILPRQYKDNSTVKRWLQDSTPNDLALPPNTYVSDSVLMQWEEDEYEAVIEDTQQISLDSLKKRGAISRLNEIFLIDKNPEELVALIEGLEEQYLKNVSGITIVKKLEPQPLSFLYQVDLTLNEVYQTKSSRELAKGTITLSYRIDELGNPLALELRFTTVFENKIAQADPVLINQMGSFISQMFDALTGQLHLYGVNGDNPSLAYANTTLYYEGQNEANAVAKKIMIR